MSRLTAGVMTKIPHLLQASPVRHQSNSRGRPGQECGRDMLSGNDSVTAGSDMMCMVDLLKLCNPVILASFPLGDQLEMLRVDALYCYVLLKIFGPVLVSGSCQIFSPCTVISTLDHCFPSRRTGHRVFLAPMECRIYIFDTVI